MSTGVTIFVGMALLGLGMGLLLWWMALKARP